MPPRQMQLAKRRKTNSNSHPGPRSAPARMQEEESEEQESVEEESEEEERPSRAGRRSARGSSGAAAAAAAAPVRGASSAAAAAAAAGAAAARSVPPGVPLCQALLRFFTVNGRATRTKVARVFDAVKERCADADSLSLNFAEIRAALNDQIRFMELEIKMHRSEIDEEEWWCLVDNTERAPVARAVVDDGEDEDGAAAAAAPGGSRRASGGAAAAAAAAPSSKTLDAGAMSKLLNPSLFTEGEVEYFRVVLDSTLASPTGKLNWATALSRRHAVTVEGLSGAALKKLRLTDAAAEHALRRLLAHGWLRELPASLALLDGGKGDRFICLGERSYTELKRYVENKTEGRQCAVCVKSCVLGVTCQQQSSESKAAAENDERVCTARMHYACAKSLFEQGKDSCPEAACKCKWDRYLEASRVVRVREEAKAAAAAAAAAAEPAAAAAAPASAARNNGGVKRRVSAIEDM